jgi:hypothetical protein
MVKIAIAGASGRMLPFKFHSVISQLLTILAGDIELAREILDGLVDAGRHEIVGLVRKVLLPLRSLLKLKYNTADIPESLIISSTLGGSMGTDKLRRYIRVGSTSQWRSHSPVFLHSPQGLRRSRPKAFDRCCRRHRSQAIRC